MNINWNKQKPLKTWFIPILIIILIFLHYSTIAKPIENAAIFAIQPVQTRLYSWVQPYIGQDTELSKKELIERNAQLEQQIQDLIVANAELKTLADDTNLLEEQIEFLKNKPFTALHARVTSRSTENLSQTIIINKGAQDGVHEGLPVVIKNGILVGTIQSVEDHSAEVLLITSFDSRISAAVQNEKESPGIVQGAYNLSLEMNYIPQLDPIHLGDSVFTSGSDPYIPHGLVIGQLETISNEPGSLFQKATLRPFFDHRDVSIVSILLP